MGGLPGAIEGKEIIGAKELVVPLSMHDRVRLLISSRVRCRLAPLSPSQMIGPLVSWTK
jgi:hypothetical protein